MGAASDDTSLAVAAEVYAPPSAASGCAPLPPLPPPRLVPVSKRPLPDVLWGLDASPDAARACAVFSPAGAPPPLLVYDTETAVARMLAAFGVPLMFLRGAVAAGAEGGGGGGGGTQAHTQTGAPRDTACQAAGGGAASSAAAAGAPSKPAQTVLLSAEFAREVAAHGGAWRAAAAAGGAL